MSSARAGGERGESLRALRCLVLADRYEVIVIGGGHAGVEAAWAAANLLPVGASADAGPTVALVTLDPSKIGVMSCNPAIGGLAKGQMVREIDAMGGVMGLAADATGIQFKVLNTSKGAAVRGPRAQCDKHAYAEVVQTFIAARREIHVIAASVDDLVVQHGRVEGVRIRMASGLRGMNAGGLETTELRCRAVVLTTGTFMRGLMHTGEQQTIGGRFGEGAAIGISGALRDLGFDLGRLKTGTPPRLRRASINWEGLERADGDAAPTPFSELSGDGHAAGEVGDSRTEVEAAWVPSLARFPVLEQVDCRVTRTNAAMHDLIRANLHRAPMYSGQIESIGPRYCPSLEDKVVRFAEKDSHQVFLEPESLRDDWVYCNGISTSLPADVQDGIVRGLPGCERAEVYRYGYAVEYDMVRPHQLNATAMTKSIEGLFLAGQINGTSGYEEAAGQGLVAGINAAHVALNREPITLGRDEAYIGVMLDDLVTKTPTEPYRMFTSRAEHRLLLRADNAPERLTPLAERLGMLSSTALGRLRSRRLAVRANQLRELSASIDSLRINGAFLRDLVRRPEFGAGDLAGAVEGTGGGADGAGRFDPRVCFTALADRQYASYVITERAEIRRHAKMERRRIPAAAFSERSLSHMRTEARQSLLRFRPETFGQASRLEGLTPADLTLLAVLLKRQADADASPTQAGAY